MVLFCLFQEREHEVGWAGRVWVELGEGKECDENILFAMAKTVGGWRGAVSRWATLQVAKALGTHLSEMHASPLLLCNQSPLLTEEERNDWSALSASSLAVPLPSAPEAVLGTCGYCFLPGWLTLTLWLSLDVESRNNATKQSSWPLDQTTPDPNPTSPICNWLALGLFNISEHWSL